MFPILQSGEAEVVRKHQGLPSKVPFPGGTKALSRPEPAVHLPAASSLLSQRPVGWAQLCPQKSVLKSRPLVPVNGALLANIIKLGEMRLHQATSNDWRFRKKKEFGHRHTERGPCGDGGPGHSALRWVGCLANPGEARTVGGLQKLEEGKDGVFF